MSVTDVVGDPNYYAYGFHGSSAAAIAAIVLTRSFEPSANSYADGRGDWLGPGFYFWQDAPTRVWEWLRAPRQRGRLDPTLAVLIAKIRLADCLDLLDTRWQFVLRRAYIRFRNTLPDPDEMPENPPDPTAPAWHPLDDAVIRMMIQRGPHWGYQFASMRAAFQEGEPLFDGSAFFDASHVQIAVFDDSAIGDYWGEPLPPPWLGRDDGGGPSMIARPFSTSP